MKSLYKHTNVGMIPSDWEVKKLGDIGECLIGLTYSPANIRAHGTLVLRSSNIQDDALVFNDNVFVDAEIPKRIRIRGGDILVCVRNGSRALIGKCALLDQRVIGDTFGAFMSVFRTSDHAFVFHQFRSGQIQGQIGKNIGATINQITNKDLNNFEIPYPTDDGERKLIAATLSDVDELIDALDRLIAKKRDLKQAAMQRLLTGQARLPGFGGDWEVKKLARLGEFLKGRGVTREQSHSGHIPCVRYGEIYTTHQDVIRGFKSWISPAVASTATKLKCGDILFAGSGETKAEIGKCVAFVDDFETYAGGDIVILRPRDADSVFLGYALNTPAASAQKANRGQGDAVVHISAASLADVQIAIPAKSEQTAIATVLSDIDAEVAALEARREKTRALKQGMMQELLTGRIRLV